MGTIGGGGAAGAGTSRAATGAGVGDAGAGEGATGVWRAGRGGSTGAKRITTASSVFFTSCPAEGFATTAPEDSTADFAAPASGLLPRRRVRGFSAPVSVAPSALAPAAALLRAAPRRLVDVTLPAGTSGVSTAL